MSIALTMHRERQQRLARMHARTVPDTGINLRNGRTPPRLPPVQKGFPITAQFLMSYRFPFALVMADILSKASVMKRAPVTTDAIISATARQFGVSVDQIKSRIKTNTIVFPRQIAMFLAKDLAGKSLPEIGRRFGRDHSTVLHAVRKIRFLSTYPEVAYQISAIRNVLGVA